ncbi:MAG: serine protease [Asticcacaulis sp.]
MDADLTLTLIEATVQIDQPISEGRRMVGTGFLVSVPKHDGTPEIVLVTAAHVFEKMPETEVRIGWRIQGDNGGWQYAPTRIPIRNDKGPLWYQNPEQDVAVIPIDVPPEYEDAAIPVDWLADENTFALFNIKPGDEMMTLGYPHGLSANKVGFPILRAGRVSSYPLGPLDVYPTFLIDLTAIPGNSGGPVFMTDKLSRAPDTEVPPMTFISGILTKQVELDNQRLELGLVTHAVFVRHTITLMQNARAKAPLVVRASPAAPAPIRTPESTGATRDVEPIGPPPALVTDTPPETNQ